MHAILLTDDEVYVSITLHGESRTKIEHGLAQATGNLIANAIKYTPRGEVVIGAQGTGAEGTVECWVSDNGAGIPEDRLGIIFNKLETDPEKEEGTGLGLAIVKTFVEAHGGTVSVESKEGVGSTFRFTLPGRTKVSGT